MNITHTRNAVANGPAFAFPRLALYVAIASVLVDQLIG